MTASADLPGPASIMAETRSREVSWEEFARLWERFLDDLESRPSVVVVEGERDRAALQQLGVRTTITLVHHGQALAKVAHDLQESDGRVVILTDWDTEGGHLAQRLREFLGDGAVDLDVDFRRQLARATRREIVHVEGLAGWARRLAERDGGSVEMFLDGR